MSLTSETMLIISILTTIFMIGLSLVMYLSDREVRHAHVLEFWTAYAFYFGLSYVTEGYSPKVVALSTLGLVWRTRTIICILSDVSGHSLFRRWHFYFMAMAYGLSVVLALFDFPFQVFTLPACLSIFTVGISSLYNCCLNLSKDRRTPLHYLLQIIVGVVFFHILDYPFLRFEHEYTGLAFALVLISTIALAVILPTLSVYELQRDKSRKLEGKLLERNQMLESQAKMSSLGEMTSSLVHEINNLLLILQARSTQMKRALLKKESHDEALLKNMDQVMGVIERMNSITQSLKIFSRDSKQENFREVPLKVLIDDCAAMAGERFLEGNIPLMVGPVPAVNLECKRVQIEQVILNLLNNAFDAVAALPSKWVRLDFETSDQGLQILITDSGKGVPAELQTKIMEPFFSTKEVGKGTGLGLSISRGIIEEHHGRLRLDPFALNTTFIIEIPLTQPC